MPEGPTRIPLPPPLDGENASTCLAELTAADNASWKLLEDEWAAANGDPVLENAAYARYVARWLVNNNAYRGCMGLPPA